MTAAQHTPGPWSVLDLNGVFVLAEDGLTVAATTHQLDFARAPGRVQLQNAHLIAAAPDLLAAWTMGSQADTPTMLDWVADRLVHVYGESPNIDFVLTLRERAAAGRAAVAKAEGRAS